MNSSMAGTARVLSILSFLGVLLVLPVGFAHGAPNLTSISVTPVDPYIDIGWNQPFTAMGTFSDGTERILGGNTWSTLSPLANQRYCPGLASWKGLIYVIGGERLFTDHGQAVRVDTYNPKTDQWRTRAPIPEGMGCPQVGVDEINGIIYVVGFREVYDPGYALVSDVYAYDVSTNTWTKKASLPTVRMGFAVAVSDGILYVFGGQIPGGVNTGSIVEAYNPSTNTWSTKAPLPVARHSLSAGVVKGKIYVLGGVTGGGSIDTVNAYDAATDTWTTVAPMPLAGSQLGVESAKGLLYTVGGVSSSLVKTDSTVQAYDPTRDAWTVVAPIPVIAVLGPGPLYGSGGYAAAVADGKLYALNIGGDLTANGSLWAFTPPEVSWSSDDKSIATINGDGLAQATVTAGATMITASVGAVSGSTSLTTLNQPLYRLRVLSNEYGVVALYSDATGIDSCAAGGCDRYFPKGVTVELAGYSYSIGSDVKWDGACAGQGEICTVTMDGDQVVTAKFRVIPY